MPQSPTSEFSSLKTERRAGVCLVTLCRPEFRNALTKEMADELLRTVATIQADNSIRALVIAGAEGHFCAGGDIRGMRRGENRSREEVRTSLRGLHTLVTALAQIQVPVIAAVDGAAYGAGFSLALLADIVLVSDRARLCMVFQRMGLLPDLGAMHTLPRFVGVQRAKELFLSGREVCADEAVSLGIAMEKLPPDKLLDRAEELALSLSNASPQVISALKQAMAGFSYQGLEPILKWEQAEQPAAVEHEYHREAVSNFLRKAPLRFQWPAKDGDRTQ